MIKLKKWFETHNLYLNLSKTKVLPLCITKARLPRQNKIKVHEGDCRQRVCNCSELELVSSWKYLGIEIDQHLRWDSHIDTLVKRIRRLFHSFIVLRGFLNKTLLKEVYYALCQSSLEYGICAYGRANKTTLESIKVTQNTILKIIFKKDRLFSTDSLYRETKILNINCLFKRNICTYIFKNKDKVMNYSEHTYNLRRKKPILPRKNTSKGQLSIDYLGIKIFENLPIEI
ncbi:hypothetical protein WDU94_009825, partial [Cyamophila willieti]